LAQLPLLAHQLVTAEGVTPQRWMLVLHGVFGLGTNFRSIARAAAQRRPDWGFVLVDLRAHGESQGLGPPHDLDAVVADLDRLIAGLGRPVEGIMGHSFGGKVTLTFLEQHPGAMKVALVLDAMPGARVPAPENDLVVGVLETLESLQQPFASRDDFKNALRSRGYDQMLVDWLAMNVRRAEDTYTLRLDLPAIRALLTDYWARDLWRVVEDPASAARLALVIGGRSHVYDANAREHASRAQLRNPHLRVVVLERAAHWVQVDDPEGLLNVLSDELASAS
jgi:pimeloyl-ACP methyl ester carboxylesterase